jgi:hypothetical protein
MSDKPSPIEPWVPKEFAFYGALLGLMVGVVHAYVHAFWSRTGDANVVEHVLWETVISMVAGAALSAILAVIRNRLAQNRS